LKQIYNFFKTNRTVFGPLFICVLLILAIATVILRKPGYAKFVWPEITRIPAIPSLRWLVRRGTGKRSWWVDTV